jgi:hypothetical protein
VGIDLESARLRRPLLLAVVRGLSPHAVVTDRWPTPALAGAVAVPLIDAADDLGAALAAADAPAAFLSLGLQVEQRALSLRPRGRGDDALLEVLARRPTGPAPVTLLEFNDLETVAAHHGQHGQAFAVATDRLAEHLQTAARVLRQGDAPELWLIAAGASLPVTATFDLAATLADLGPQRPAVRAAIAPQLAHLACGNQRALAAATALLSRPAVAACGRVVAGDRAGALQFLPHAHIALGRRPWHCRPPRADERRAAAFLPHLPRAASQLTARDLLARLCQRALELLQAAAPPPVPTAPAVVDGAAVLARP